MNLTMAAPVSNRLQNILNDSKIVHMLFDVNSQINVTLHTTKGVIVISGLVDNITFTEVDNNTLPSISNALVKELNVVELTTLASRPSNAYDALHINKKKNTLEQGRQDIIDALVNNSKANIIAAEKGLPGKMYIEDGTIHRNRPT
ncbi:uncharacterized protein ACN2A1_011666 [Glossina fuscipes fuscipes]